MRKKRYILYEKDERYWFHSYCENADQLMRRSVSIERRNKNNFAKNRKPSGKMLM